MSKHSEPVGAYQDRQLTCRVDTRTPGMDVRVSRSHKLSPNTEQAQQRRKHTVSSLHMEWIDLTGYRDYTTVQRNISPSQDRFLEVFIFDFII